MGTKLVSDKGVIGGRIPANAGHSTRVMPKKSNLADKGNEQS
mgnify:CR=1 FL=1